ncbi:MAG: N-6 DNA methylase, partial [Spirochaetes bacterium]|nr:N-6 DNA methylase [Spirochaetota bacterium]
NKIINKKIFIDYLYIPSQDEKDLYQKQCEFWNENLLNSYIVFSENTTYTFNAKQKPDKNNLLKSKIKDFSYGVNSPDIEELKKYISKEKIDSGYYFQFIKDRIKKKNEEVDKDLLENIVAVYKKLKIISNFSFSLIFKCIFIKFLEDRNFIDSNLIKILESGSPNKLIQKFNYMKKINGDIFNDESDLKSLNEKHIKELYIFFISDYKRGQAYLFPYKFDKIPIELLSNVYENFVDKEIKKKQGVYYTPIFIIEFILGFAIKEKLKQSKDIKILDPSCGSGSFLVESYKKIIENYKNESIDILKKIEILKNSLFGVDIDEYALKIASFSLYLALFENENPEILKNMIKENKIKLPNLINKNLIKADSLTDSIFKDIKFDCIMGNPPWGSNEKYKKIINNDYKNKISDYQQSQIFLLKVINWANDKTTIAMIVNNSNFYNLNADKFRKEFLKTYDLYYYFELSKMKEIFENADYPSAILIFNKKSNIENEIKYISVYQDKLAEFLKIITYCEKDIKKIKQQDLIEEDILWRVFVNGNWEDYQLIKRKWIERDKKVIINCNSGLQPKKNMQKLGDPIYKNLIEIEGLKSYYLDYNTLKPYNYNQDFRRNPAIKKPGFFQGKRILVKAVPDSDNLRLVSAFTDKEIIHKHNILSLKINKTTDYKSYLAILNSSFIGYFLYNISPQWGKGKKQEILRNKDIERWLSFPDINYSDKKIKNLIQLVDEIENLKNEKYNNNQLFNDYDNKIKEKEKRIDHIVYGLYNLKTYEIDLIEDFFLINQDRKNDVVNHKDIEKYIKKFRESFNLVLEKKYYLNASYSIDNFYGAYVCFDIVDLSNIKEKIENQNSNIFKLINNDKKDELINWSLFKMDKNKIYDNNKLYIIKSNYLKDWTKTEARKDASEEIGEFFKKLPKD